MWNAYRHSIIFNAFEHIKQNQKHHHHATETHTCTDIVQLEECGQRGVGLWSRGREPIARWKSDNIVPVITARKQASAHEQNGAIGPPSYPPRPQVGPITSQLLGVGEKTKISRTNLMHSHCMKDKECADEHKCGCGRWAGIVLREWVDVFFPSSFIP